MSRNPIAFAFYFCLVLIACSTPKVLAGDYVLSASGIFSSTINNSLTFDGTNYGTLPPLLPIDQLIGGTFTATFQFSTVTPSQGSWVVYSQPESSLLEFELFDANGEVLHHGSESFIPYAYVLNHYDNGEFSADQVSFRANLNSISGLQLSPPLYSPRPDFFSIGDFTFFGNVDGGANYVDDLSIPIDAGTYSSFPDRMFDVYLRYGDGDYNSQVDPFQVVDTYVVYDITSLSVTPVPEPASSFLLVSGLLVLKFDYRQSMWKRRK